ncbi:MAG TPA: AraC family transcriptional regulator [Rhodocyclaceae bacterium]|nr:MAG: hypothetical protein AUK49_12315 [Betaproteobacteria bacterium CG2_30_68_42]PIV76963.1 MAG: AraC family transcriptional regulator [Rhodocyclales bacterium CG17_big_fil_post_rev_8_21_14_2_50_68_7]PIX75064.1 MAG: AraC family transcriptional regulator [Rhodocyclales bacterium CG_4_10_14_3_um_filter_68_10]PJA56697.1 MAG: AraC family transcriptional regulator [Rhodocyclales bacterium CG_4_9_14_3_um_filter_68_10]HCX33959.1 AraC family transcriptional regulator [Rhodocyclaceae bacterium]
MAAPDSISRLLDRVGMRAKTFHTGTLCGLHMFAADEGVGHLHVIREGVLRALQTGHPAMALRAPALVFYPRPLDHRLEIEEPAGAHLLCASVQYGAGMENAITRSFPSVMVIPFDAQRSVGLTLTLLFEEAAQAHTGRQVMLDRLCDVLLIQIVRFAIERKLVARGILAGLAHPRLARVLGEVLDAPGHPWTIGQMAMRAHLSRNGFACQFREVIGMTPGGFVGALRVAHAQRLLRQGRPIGLVSQDVGYSGQPAFSRAFLRETGVSPSAWARRAMAD